MTASRRRSRRRSRGTPTRSARSAWLPARCSTRPRASARRSRRGHRRAGMHAGTGPHLRQGADDHRTVMHQDKPGPNTLSGMVNPSRSAWRACTRHSTNSAARLITIGQGLTFSMYSSRRSRRWNTRILSLLHADTRRRHVQRGWRAPPGRLASTGADPRQRRSLPASVLPARRPPTGDLREGARTIKARQCRASRSAPARNRT